MKLCVIHINGEKGSEAYTALIDGVFNRVKQPGTEITHRYARLKRASDTIYAYPYYINSLDVVHRFHEASNDGFDGVMVACSGDPGVIQGRSVSKIPVVGPFAAAMHLACEYGLKFGVVTVEDRPWLEAVHMIVDANGMRSRCSGVRSIETPSKIAFTQGFVDSSSVIADIERQARRLVDEGANSVILASAGLSCIGAAASFTQIPGLGVPVFDVLTVGLKTLEMRVELTTKGGFPVTSRVGLTELQDVADTARVKAQFAVQI
jgi:allantoin racemase